MNLLGKILFPRLDQWQRRRELKMIFVSVLTGLVFAGLIGLVLVLKNHSMNN
jgi:hypothetical protein